MAGASSTSTRPVEGSSSFRAMNIRDSRLRAILSAPLAALMLTSSVLMPLIERADLGREPVVESQHDPNRCPPAHDHSVCVLSNGSTASLAAPGANDSAPRQVRMAPLLALMGHGGSSSFFRAPARAPPTL